GRRGRRARCGAGLRRAARTSEAHHGPGRAGAVEPCARAGVHAAGAGDRRGRHGPRVTAGAPRSTGLAQRRASYLRVLPLRVVPRPPPLTPDTPVTAAAPS